MNRRQFLGGLVATAAGVLIPTQPEPFERSVWALDGSMLHLPHRLEGYIPLVEHVFDGPVAPVRGTFTIENSGEDVYLHFNGISSPCALSFPVKYALYRTEFSNGEVVISRSGEPVYVHGGGSTQRSVMYVPGNVEFSDTIPLISHENYYVNP